MTRKEHLEYCIICLNKSFDPKCGVICSLTGKIADFDDTCENFKEDEKQAIIKTKNNEALIKEEKISLKSGRFILFFLGGIYLLLGIFEGFIIDNHHIVFGTIDWIIALCFIGFGIWSFKKPYLSYIFGLSLYVFLMLLLAIIEPLSLLYGLVWKILTITVLSYSIKTSINQKSLVKYERDDLLDNL